MSRTLSFLLASFIFIFNAAKASDVGNIVPLDYERDGAQTLAVIKENLPLLGHMPEDPEKYQKEETRLLTKYDACMYNNMHMSSGTKIVAGSFERAVLIGSEKEVAGVISFFQRAPIETYYPSKWYIEEIAIKNNHSALNLRNLALYARSKVQERNGSQLLVHMLLSDELGQKAMIAAGFKELEPSEFEKTEKLTAFEWTAENS